MNLGAAGEKAAAKMLKRSGYTVIARNYHCPVGEIDIIALDEDTIVFVEVKTRRDDAAADPEVNVTYRKKLRLTRAAKHFLMEKSAQHRPSRFDVVSVVLRDGADREIEHFVDAFSPTPR